MCAARARLEWHSMCDCGDLNLLIYRTLARAQRQHGNPYLSNRKRTPKLQNYRHQWV